MCCALLLRRVRPGRKTFQHFSTLSGSYPSRNRRDTLELRSGIKLVPQTGFLKRRSKRRGKDSGKAAFLSVMSSCNATGFSGAGITAECKSGAPFFTARRTRLRTLAVSLPWSTGSAFSRQRSHTALCVPVLYCSTEYPVSS